MKKRIGLVVCAFTIAVITAFNGSETFVEQSGYGIGDYATDFSLKNVDGKMVSMADYKNAKGFILVFTCNHCPYSQKYEQRIIDLAKKYNPKGFQLIAINPNNPEKEPEDSFDNMVKRAKEKGYSFPYLIDSKQDIFPQYGAKATPQVFVLQRDSKGNRVQYIGAVDDNYKDPSAAENRYVENAVDALLEGKEVPVKTTKAIGCSIKI